MVLSDRTKPVAVGLTAMAPPPVSPPLPFVIAMPLKTTFFAPKPRTGMVFRSLDEPV